jgi:hypothetical protein
MVFDLTDSPRWTFEGLTTRQHYYHGFKFNGSSTDCVLRNIRMRDHGESGVKGTSEPAAGVYPDRLRVERCDIGFSTSRGGTRSVVEGIDGVGVNGMGRSKQPALSMSCIPAASPTGVFTKGNSSDTIIENNRFENCDIGASFGGGGTGAPTSATTTAPTSTGAALSATTCLSGQKTRRSISTKGRTAGFTVIRFSSAG